MFRDLTITDIRPEGSDAICITFDTPADMAWKPGQYLTLRSTVGGQDIRRSYSIASFPDQPLCVGVKQVDGGAFSTFAQSLTQGKTLQVMPPEGRFIPRGEQSLLLVAAGSGITPMISIAAETLAHGAAVTLVYGNRNTASIMFKDALDALKDRYVDRFTMIHILSREPQDVELLNGRVTGEKLQRLARAGAIDLDVDGAYLCGPGAMIDDVSAMMQAGGMPAEKIHHERFYTEGTAARAPRSEAAQNAAEKGAEVEVLLDGTRRIFMVTQADDNVLDAAARQGLELPYSCKGGMCCTCRCKVTNGSAEMAVNYSLEPWELEQGFTLACQTRPTTDKLTLDFDAA